MVAVEKQVLFKLLQLELAKKFQVLSYMEKLKMGLQNLLGKQIGLVQMMDFILFAVIMKTHDISMTLAFGLAKQAKITIGLDYLLAKRIFVYVAILALQAIFANIIVMIWN